MRDVGQAVARLLDEGVVSRDGGRLRTTRKWQGAMSRAAFHLLTAGDAFDDLRVPVAHAVMEIFGDACPEEDLILLIEAMTPIEAAELGPAYAVAMSITTAR